MITIFFNQGYSIKFKHSQIKNSYFLVIVRIWNNKGRFEWEIENFYDVSDTQNMIDVITF